MRFTIEEVFYNNHPYLNGQYFRIFDNVLKRFGLGVYLNKERAEQVLNNRLSL